ncbi:MAG: branched-chain amino acid ABC transporter permease [Alphaproteobacteria bacterium]|nr:branched-chain amino acid ABC transporter permease [Alphaproteobacteria bacterium]
MRRDTLRDLAVAVIAWAALMVFPSIYESKFAIDFVIRMAAFGIFAASLNLLVGVTGMVSFGHGMFFATGAYGFGLLMQKAAISIPLAMLLTVGASALVALVVGAICVRLKEIYFAFLTLAFQMLLHSLIVAWVPLTGGDQGLTGGLPRPVFLGIDLAKQSHLYGFSATLLVAMLLVLRHLAETPFGYTLRLIRDNPERAHFLGVKVFWMRLAAFVAAGSIASVGGIIMALFVSGAFPEFANWTMSGEAIFMIMLGGSTVFLGPIAGTAILLVLNDFVTRLTEHYGLTLGLIILLFTLGLRKGLLDFIADAIARRRERAGQGG